MRDTTKPNFNVNGAVAYIPKDLSPMGILLEVRDNFGFLLHIKLCLNISPISMYLVNSEVFINA